MFATSGRLHHNITNSKVAILSYTSSIPSFDMSNVSWVTLDVDKLASGQFGEVKLATIKTLNLIVAAKVFKVNLPRKTILAEAV